MENQAIHMKSVENLVRTLERERVEYMFGILGHRNMQILEEIYRLTVN